MAEGTRNRYWLRTVRLKILMLAACLLFTLAIPMLVSPLNQLKFLGFPLGFYMSAQGSLIAFVLLTFWFVRRQDAIERQEGVDDGQEK